MLVEPDKDLFSTIDTVLGQLDQDPVVNISVPSVTNQLPHRCKEYRNINPDTVEMESAATLSQAKEIGVRASALLVISDNHSHSISQAHPDKYKAMYEVMGKLVTNIEKLVLPPLPNWGEASINKYLANVIQLDHQEKNIYRDNAQKE